MRSPPIEVIASWPKPNYVNPDIRPPDPIVGGVITLTAALIFLGLRMYVRLGIMRKTELDDWVMVVAAVFATAATITILLIFTRYGWNRHIWDLTLPILIAGRQASYAAQALFIPGALLVKISILLSYLRIAPQNSMFRRLSLTAPWVIATTTIVFLIVMFTECRPFSSYWNLTRMSIDCIDETPPLFAYAYLSVVYDFFVWVLPLPTIYRAGLPLSQRLALIALFSVGLFVVAAAVIRIYYLDMVLRQTYDVTWEGSHLWLWTAVEANLGIICGCVPWLKSLVTGTCGGRGMKGTGSSGAGTGSGRGNGYRGRGGSAVPTIGSAPVGFTMESLTKTQVGVGDKGTYLDLESNCSETERLA
ncbi:hypothetical protein C8A05DRAFT_16148 [Staphylotrichum tortipilum]|uniref:Rhodopsin domain-containing protein n=1 Tax=Staphylotrichum tortipilum TaxID=2831512 RepID=A0AAN6MIV3_9PEZI|nr:hypothetical protein C8A05DRAFT_16148 [Staphylotrichum longicolle]